MTALRPLANVAVLHRQEVRDAAAPGRAKRAPPQDVFERAAVPAPTVKALVNKDYFPALMTALDGAQHSIDIIEYNFYSESGQVKTLVNKLIALKQEKPELTIRVFLEGDHGDAATRNKATADLLTAAGIDVQLDSPKVVTHTKAFCFDGTRVIAGSTNLTNTSMGLNNEVSLDIESPKVGVAFGKYFDQLRSAPTKLDSKKTTVGTVTMLGDATYEAELLKLIKGATTRLDASMYDFNYVDGDAKAKEIMDALVTAAGKGVKVRLFLEQSSDNFAPEITAANERAYVFLQSKGIEVHMDKPSQISHQKFIVADSKTVLLGSSNWTRADFVRHQLDWLVKDNALATQLEQLLTDEIAQDGTDPVAQP